MDASSRVGGNESESMQAIMRAEPAVLDWTTCPAVERNSDKVSGAWEAGATVDEFLEWFPGVSWEQVNIVLEHASHSLEDTIPA